MRDFSSRYRKVQWFGIWADETADAYGYRDAVNILADAAGQCFEEDVRRRRDVLDALDYLSGHGGEEKTARRFRTALDEISPSTRFKAAGDAVRAMQRRTNR